MNVNNTPVIVTVVIAAVVMLLAGFFAVGSINKNLQLATAELPTEEGIANAVIAGVNIPTISETLAQDIADLIEVPDQHDTWYSVLDYQDALALELATKHLEDDDFREELADYLLNDGDADDIGQYLDSDFDEDEIGKIVVIKADEDNFWWFMSDTRAVEFTTRITVDADGDSADIKVKITMYVDDLDRSDDYEDAEVRDGFYNFDFVRCYDNFC